MITRREQVPGRSRAPRKPRRGRFSAVRFNLPTAEPIRDGKGARVFGPAIAACILASALWPTADREDKEAETFVVEAEIPEPPQPPEAEPPELPPPLPPPRELPKEAPRPAPQPPEEKPPEPPPSQFGLDEEELGEKGDMAVATGNTVDAKADSVIQLPPPVMRPEMKPVEEPLRGKLVSVTRLDRMPKVRVATKPEYTPEMREACIAGKVKARLLVDSDGQVAKVEILQDIGFGTREASLRALKQVQFDPGTLDGTPVAVWIPFTFSYEWQE